MHKALKWFDRAGGAGEFTSIERFLDSETIGTYSGAYGVSFRLSGIDGECKSDQELSKITTDLASMIRQLPEEVSLYQYLIKRRGAEIPVSKYEDSPCDAIAEAQRKRRMFMQGRGLGSVRLFWTLCVHPPRLLNTGSAAEAQATTDRMLRLLRSTRLSVMHSLGSTLGLEQMDADGMCQLYSYLATLDESVMRRSLSSKNRVAAQIGRSKLRWSRGDLRLGNRYVRVFSASSNPKWTEENLYGELIRIDADLVLVIESRRMSSEDVRKLVDSKQSFLDITRHKVLTILAHARGNHAILESAHSKAADKSVEGLSGVIDDIDNRGMSYTRTSVIGLLHSKNRAELDDQIAQVRRVFSRCETGLVEEDLGNLAAYQSIFPAASLDGKSTNLCRRVLREDHLARMSLIYAPYAGEPYSDTLEDEATVILETRDKTMFHLDPYSRGRRGKLILGAQGTGKSFQVNLEMEMEAKRGGFIFVHDCGGSFEETALRYGGKLVRFGLDQPRLAPFELPPTKQNLDFIFRLVRLLLIKGGAQISAKQELDIYDRVVAMYGMDPEVRRLKYLRLQPALEPFLAKWVEDGIYGSIFDNVTDELRMFGERDPGAPYIVVFEYADIEKNHGDLMEPLLFWLRYQTRQITNDPANWGIPKLEIYDEVFRHMKDPAMVDTMLTTATQARKELGGVILATQEASQVQKCIKIIRNACSDTQFMGGPFDREYYRELFSLNDRQLDILGGLKARESLLVREGYSKVLVTAVDEETQWRYTTKNTERKRRREAIEKFGREKAYAYLTAAAGNGNSKTAVGANL